jgi:hypothetical protein
MTDKNNICSSFVRGNHLNEMRKIKAAAVQTLLRNGNSF